jgi:Reverse transcriptase (RNA-dependent DNA polymerase)
MKRQVPVNLLCIFEAWFSFSVSCVKWDGHLSRFFSLAAGVRQGGVLSPILFSNFIYDNVDKVKSVNVGCYISLLFCGIFLYADDILLLFPSITALQLLIDTCEKELDNIDMLINVKKSSCIRFGSRFNKPCAELVSNHGAIIVVILVFNLFLIAHLGVNMMMPSHAFTVHLMQSIARLIHYPLKTLS